MRVSARAATALAVILTALLAATGCSAASGGPPTQQPGTVTQQPVGTVTHLTTITTVPTTSTVSEQATTIVTTPTDPTLVPPPPATPEPAPVRGECPYLSAAQVRDANGQNVGAIETIATDPHPICIFHRPDGSVMAVVRVVVADSPEAAAAAVNQHVPIDDSYPVAKPQGWVGGALGNASDGVDGYPDGRSIYAVSKGTTAVIAISNQNQAIKGRQMVTDVIGALGL